MKQHYMSTGDATYANTERWPDLEFRICADGGIEIKSIIDTRKITATLPKNIGIVEAQANWVQSAVTRHYNSQKIVQAALGSLGIVEQVETQE